MRVFDRSAILALLVALFSSIAILMLVADVYRDRTGVLEQRSEFIALTGQVLRQVEAQGYLVENQQDYDRVMESVKTGTTQRRSWIETLKAAKKELNLPEIQFDIYPRIPIGSVPSNLPIDVGQETIELQLGLLHEGEWLMLFDYLKRNIASPFELISLDMHPVVRIKGSDMTLIKEINLEVNCTFRWYSITQAGEDIVQS